MVELRVLTLFSLGQGIPSAGLISNTSPPSRPHPYLLGKDKSHGNDIEYWLSSSALNEKDYR